MQSSVDRRGNAHRRSVEELRGLLAEACARTRLDRSAWSRQDTADGELALVPETVQRSRLAVDLTRELVRGLRHRNADRAAAERLRLRVAIHHATPATRQGTTDATGDGPPVAVLRRLLDAPQVSFTLDVRHADLTLIVSDPLYQEVRALPVNGFRPEAFRRVHVRNRGLDFNHMGRAAEPSAAGLLAWIQVPDPDSREIPPEED